MAIIFFKGEKKKKSRCWVGCAEVGTLVHCWWGYEVGQPPRDSLVIPQEVTRSIAIPLRGNMPKRTENTRLSKIWPTNAHSVIQKVEITQMPIS